MMSRPELAPGCLVLPVRAFGCGWVWNGVGGGEGRVGTLLGPEASGPHMVALAAGSLLSVGGVWWWGVCGVVGGSGFLPLSCLLLCVGGGGLVGLLFEICIVDASIKCRNLS
jgi:hypothetical protein